MQTSIDIVAPTPERYASIAVPVPLRRRFTYRVPAGLASVVAPGVRVAVPFHGRKLPGIVLDVGEAPPEGVSRIKAIAGVLDREPVFTQELLAFLVEAARYYLHPVGEVLRAGAPPVPTGAMRDLRAEGFLAEGETLPGRHLAMRTVTVVRPAPSPSPSAAPRLGKNQKAVLAIVDERGELTVEELRAHVKGARATVRGLVDKGLVTTEEREVLADPFFGVDVQRDEAPTLHAAQTVAVDAVRAAMDAQRATAFLLQGVTGSGKTEVYLRVIEHALRAQRGALVLVPEIALTPQLVSRFRARLGDAIAVLHSGLGERERHDAWHALRQGSVRLAIGARSALFAPVPDLGVLVVDEEHDGSFKQEDGFRYNARDMALLRAARANAVCVLGSATPSLESRHGAEEGRLERLVLPDRATRQSLPKVEIVDLARNRDGPSGHRLISAPLHRALERCLADGDQAILFLNRRGFATSVRCDECGAVVECPACSVALTEHRRAAILRCHYCDFATPPGQPCVACQAQVQVPLGLGTEQLEDTLREVFAPARVARLDRDIVSGAGIEKVLERLRRREIDILVGTQMVTKGHDMPGVTLVGVVLADQSLAFPDFRASERTFQLLSQVAGRAGRGERPGSVFFQTFQPTHPAIVHAAKHDYERFYRSELEARRELGYVPFSRLVAVRVDAGDDEQARRAAGEFAQIAAEHAAVRDGRVRVLGPAPAPIARIRGRYRHRLLLRGADRKALRAVAATLAARIDEGLAPARASVDIDPVAML
jgi:primosomal protein N' (replication factor Y)